MLLSTFMALEAIRSFVFRMGGRSTVRKYATGYYLWVAKKAISRLEKIRGVHKVVLGGGAMKRCVPAVSDLDLLVYTEDGLSPAALKSLCRDVAEAKKTLRRLHPIVREIGVATPTSWEIFQKRSPGSILGAVEQYCLSPEGWVENPVVEPTVRLGSRFSYCLKHFIRASSYLSQIENPIGRASFAREVSKVICFANETPLILQETKSIFDLYSNAYLSLDRVATKVLTEKGSANSFGYSPRRTSPELRLLADRWFLFLEERTDTALPKSCFPHFCYWDGGIDGGTFWSKYVQALMESSSYFVSLPGLVVSPNIYECLRQGWHPLGIPCDRVTSKTPRYFFDNLLDEVTTAYFTFPSETWIEASHPDAARWLAYGALSLASHVWTEDLALLTNQGKKKLPKTAMLLEERENMYAATPTSSDLALAVYDEIGVFLKNSIAV